MQNLFNKLLFSGIPQRFCNEIQNKKRALSHLKFTERFSLMHPFLAHYESHNLYTFKYVHMINYSGTHN